MCVLWVDRRCFVFSIPTIHNRPCAAFLYCLDWYDRYNQSLARVLPFLKPIAGYYPHKLPVSQGPTWQLFLYEGRSFCPTDYIQFEGFDLSKTFDRRITRAVIRETNKIRKQFKGCRDLRKFKLFIVRKQSKDAKRKYWHFKLLFYQARQKCRISEKIFPKYQNRIELICHYPVYATDMLHRM
jgi:hypothetical protein